MRSLYKDLTTLLEPDQIGRFKIQKFHVDGNTFYAMINGIPTGDYVKLTENGQVVMSNTPMELRTNLFFCRNAYGDVLIGGLGLGMIVLAMQDNEKVNSITVVEKNEDVIELIAKQIKFNDKVTILKGDVFTWKPDKGTKYDCIYMDIWNEIGSDIYKEEMVPLKRKFGHYLKKSTESPDRFNLCWAEYNAKNDLRLY